MLEHIRKKNRVRRLIAVCIGSFFAALVYNAYVVPNHIVYSGIGGLAIIFNNWFGIDTTIFINVATILLIVISFLLLGIKGTSYSIIGFLIYDIMITLTAPFAHLVNLHFDSTLFSMFLNASIIGISCGLVYRTGFNLGGSDILIAILQKYFKVPTSSISNKMNAVVIILGAFTFGLINSLYAVIFLIVCNYFSNRVIVGVSYSKVCFIKSKHNSKIEKHLKEDLDIGYTIIESTNGIGLLHKDIIFCVVPSDRFYDLKRNILKIDKKAEIISNDCYTVEGGYRNDLLPI